MTDTHDIHEVQLLNQGADVSNEFIPVLNFSFFTAAMASLVDRNDVVVVESLDNLIPDPRMKACGMQKEKCRFLAAKRHAAFEISQPDPVDDGIFLHARPGVRLFHH